MGTVERAKAMKSDARGWPRADRQRQQRGVRTEKAILDATIGLVAERGIHGTSLDAVSEAVGVSKSSILWHFGSKEGLLVRVAERIFEDIAEGPVKEILSLDTLEARLGATWKMFEDTVTHFPALRRLTLYLIFESVEGRPELRERLQQLYRSMRELFAAGLEGVLPEDDRRHRASVISVATFDGIFLQWLLDPDAVDIPAIRRDLAELYERAGLFA